MNNQYSGLPEAYFSVPVDEKFDIDAINSALSRAEAICIYLSTSFNGTGQRLNDRLTDEAINAVLGSIYQVKMLTNGTEGKS